MPDESRTITAQVSQEFYDKFQTFCFETEISKSEWIRESLETAMEFHAFLKQKDKQTNGKAQ